jgi:hypothetical protein
MQFVHHSHIVHSHELNHQSIARAGEYRTAIHPTTNANRTEHSRSLLMIPPLHAFRRSTAKTILVEYWPLVWRESLHVARPLLQFGVKAIGLPSICPFRTS